MKYVILLLFNCTVGQKYAARSYVAITGGLGEDVCESSGEKAGHVIIISVGRGRQVPSGGHSVQQLQQG